MSSLEACTDEELITRLRGEDQTAFTEIYRRFWDKVFTVAFHRLQNQAEAEEVVQDVFFSLWKRRSSLEIQYSLNTYLSTAAKYQIITRQRKLYLKEKVVNVTDLSNEAGVDSTQLWFSERELRQQLDHHIEQLPEKCRLVFKMSREQYKSYAQIAEELGVSEKTVEAHITRALKVLRGKLQVGLPFILYLLSK
ncbi:RNA polymerase sigma-70 factor [Pedobacter sp.]|uniref:RNA polymerase sigma factor n=1 Tax=Pedobacter sp. TaxID=1411316 RepID=UPI0031E077C9